MSVGAGSVAHFTTVKCRKPERKKEGVYPSHPTQSIRTFHCKKQLQISHAMDCSSFYSLI